MQVAERILLGLNVKKKGLILATPTCLLPKRCFPRTLQVAESLPNYYRSLDPPHALLLTRPLQQM